MKIYNEVWDDGTGNRVSGTYAIEGADLVIEHARIGRTAASA